MQWQSTGVFLPPYQDNACGDLPPSVHRLKCYLCTHSLTHIVGLQNLQSSSLSSLKMFSKPLYPPCMKIKMLFRLHSCKSFRALQTTVPGHPRASKGIPGHPSASQGIPVHPRESQGIQGHPRASQCIPGHPSASQGIPVHPRESQGIQGHPRASKGIPVHPRAS